MPPCIGLLVLPGMLTLGLACAATPPERERQAPAPDLERIVAALRDLAAGSTGVAQALKPLVAGARHEAFGESGEATDLGFPGFTSSDGYRIESVAIRVRQGGLEGAPLVLLHLGTSPCAPLDELANWVGAGRQVRIAPSPHLHEGSGVRGYARDYGTRRIELLASAGLDCVTVIGVHRPGG